MRERHRERPKQEKFIINSIKNYEKCLESEMWWPDYQLKKIFGQIQHFIHNNTTHNDRSVGFNQRRYMNLELSCVRCLLMEWIPIRLMFAALKWKFESCTECNSIYYNTVFWLYVGQQRYASMIYVSIEIHLTGIDCTQTRITSDDTQLNVSFRSKDQNKNDLSRRKPKNDTGIEYRASGIDQKHRINTFIYHSFVGRSHSHSAV